MRLLGIIFSLILLATTPTLAATLSGKVVAVADGDTITIQNKENKKVDDCEKAYKRLDFQTAMRLCQPLAEEGNAAAQARLGDMYSSLTSKPYPPRDYTEAAKWYRKAAELGVAHAQYRLGSFYKSGIGVEKNYEKAFEWGLRAAKQGALVGG